MDPNEALTKIRSLAKATEIAGNYPLQAALGE